MWTETRQWLTLKEDGAGLKLPEVGADVVLDEEDLLIDHDTDGRLCHRG